jgi:CubicO group peptidase (beta-lactamase class C family)
MSRSGGFSHARLGRLSDVLRGYVDSGAVAGAVGLICRHDEIHAEVVGVQDLAAGTPMRRDTIFRLASVTKPIAAAAAMILVEETRLRLDEPVDRHLPELANRRVLRSLDSRIDDTVPAHRPITLRDLLTFRLGFGAIMAAPGTYPIQQAVADAGLAPGPGLSTLTPDDWMARLGSLPLMHQPGERWMYHTGFDVLGVLIARAAGQPLDTFMAERISAPLGMLDTGFEVPLAKMDRFATCYRADETTGKLAVWDEARGGQWARAPVFPGAGGGLVATADDCLAFGRMMRDLGRCGTGRLLARSTVEAMTTDQITPAQKAASPFVPGFWDNTGWGFGVAITLHRNGPASVPGQYGWMGGTGTTLGIDPQEGIVAVLLTQRLMRSADDTKISDDFLALTYQAIDD